MADATPPCTPSRWARRLRRVGLLLSLLYLVGCSGLYFGQDAILFPGHRTQGTADAATVFASGVQRITLATADGTPIVARYRPTATERESPTVLFFYGNAMCAAWCDDIVAQLNDIGCNVLLADYAGYGESGGRPSEAALYATADAEWAYLTKTLGLPANRIIVMGWSLGSAVALDLASRETPAALITLSAFRSVPGVAHDNYPLIPTSWLLRSKFDNLSKVPNVKCPVLMFHGRQDTLIEPKNADALSAAFGSRAKLVWLERADHNTMFEAEPMVLRANLALFVNQVAPVRQIIRN